MSKRSTTFILQPGKHITLGIERSTAAHQQATRQVFLVECFKHSLAMNEPEQIQCVREVLVDFSILVCRSIVEIVLFFRLRRIPSLSLKAWNGFDATLE